MRFPKTVKCIVGLRATICVRTVRKRRRKKLIIKIIAYPLFLSSRRIKQKGRKVGPIKTKHLSVITSSTTQFPRVFHRTVPAPVPSPLTLLFSPPDLFCFQVRCSLSLSLKSSLSLSNARPFLVQTNRFCYLITFT